MEDQQGRQGVRVKETKKKKQRFLESDEKAPVLLEVHIDYGKSFRLYCSTGTGADGRNSDHDQGMSVPWRINGLDWRRMSLYLIEGNDTIK